MQVIEDKSYDEERALYGEKNLIIRHCAFQGVSDGESALKCAQNIEVTDTLFALRYPLWHDAFLTVNDCTMAETCRAAAWYSSDVKMILCKMYGIKAVRECRRVIIDACSIVSPEFGWFCKEVRIKNTAIEGEYFMLRSSALHLDKVILRGKYSLQYVENAIIENCTLNTKDALWHARHVFVRNSVVNGEYLGWYSEDVTFENCLLKGTQPLCCCRSLRLIDCRMEDADRAFEKSDVEASVIGRIESIKNVASGVIRCEGAGEVIADEEGAKGKVVFYNTTA